MWKITVITNAFLMVLFWIASRIAIALAYSNFVEYPSNGDVIALPMITRLALAAFRFAVAIPMVWALVSFVIYKFTRKKTTADRNEILIAFTSVTIFLGFLMLVFFGLAGILPYLRIGMVAK